MKAAATFLLLFCSAFLFWWGVWHWFKWTGIYVAIGWTIGMIVYFIIKSKRTDEDIQDNL